MVFLTFLNFHVGGRQSCQSLWSLDCTASEVAGALLDLGMFLFQGHGKSDQNLVVVGAMLVPLAGRLEVCVQVYHIGDEGPGVEG